MLRLKDKHILITGGTSGIGLETARQFLKEGAKVAITGRHDKTLKLAETELGSGVLLFKSDAGNPGEQKELVKKLGSYWSRLDAAFLNAGDVTHKPVEEWDEVSFDQMMNTNLRGPFFLLQALKPLLANPSSVILCGSVAAHLGLAASTPYAASKAGLSSFARTLSGEWFEQGIRVNTLSPGPTRTPALQTLAGSAERTEHIAEQLRKLVPIGRLGTPLEIAHAAVFLASDESSFVVGTELLVDGGVGNL